MKISFVRSFALAVVLTSGVGPLIGATSSWTGGGGDGNWTTAGNWQGSTVVGAASPSTTSSQVATFNNATNTSVTIDAGRNLKSIVFDPGAGAFTFTGGPLVLTSFATIQMNDSVAATETFNNQITGVLTFSFVNNSTSTGILNMAGNVVGSGTAASILTLSGTSVAQNTVSGAISDGAGGALSLTKSFVGNWTLSGNNTFTGQVIINTGALSVSSLNSVGVGHVASSSLGGPTTVANGTINLGSSGNAGILVYTGTGEVTDRVINLQKGGTLENDGTTGRLAFSSNFTTVAATAGTLTLRGSNTANNEIQGNFVSSVGGTTNLVKTDAGKWILSGSNSYNGTTTVSQGTLLINGSHTGASNYLVQTGGILGGSGSITTAGNAPVTINSGGMLDPIGNFTISVGTGTMSVSGAVSTTASASLLFNLNTTSNSDKVTLTTGTLNIGANTMEFDDFHFTFGVGFGAGVYTLFDAGAIAGALGTNVTGTINDLPATIIKVGSDIEVSVVPEPSTYGMLAFGCALLVFAQRQRSRRRA